MKNIALIIFTIFCSVTQIAAQIKAGFKGGLNIANVHNSIANDFTSLVAYNFGFIAKYSAEDSKTGVTIEALLSQKGFKGLLIPSGTTAYSLTYVSIPALMEYRPAKALYVQVGPEFNYLVNAGMKNSTLKKSMLDKYNKFDFALAAGVGYNVFKNLNLEVRYSNGLNQLSKQPDITGKYYNRVFQFNAAYLF